MSDLITVLMPPRVNVLLKIALADHVQNDVNYLALLRVTTSNMTANTSTRPRTTYWRDMSVCIRFMPLVNDI